MAAKLRSLITRAARRVVSEDLLILFRGPRPNPASAVPSAGEAGPLAKKVDASTEKDLGIEFTRRLIEEQKKMYECQQHKFLVVYISCFAAMCFPICYMTGYDLGRVHGKRMYERQIPEESN